VLAVFLCGWPVWFVAEKPCLAQACIPGVHFWMPGARMGCLAGIFVMRNARYLSSVNVAIECHGRTGGAFLVQLKVVSCFQFIMFSRTVWILGSQKVSRHV
jgi:hypothetical protein